MNRTQKVEEILADIFIEKSENWIIRFDGTEIELRTKSPAGDDEYKEIANETVEKLNNVFSPELAYRIFSCGRTGFHLIPVENSEEIRNAR